MVASGQKLLDNIDRTQPWIFATAHHNTLPLPELVVLALGKSDAHMAFMEREVTCC